MLRMASTSAAAAASNNMHFNLLPLILLATLSCTPKGTERAAAMRLSASVLDYSPSSFVITNRYWEKGDKFDVVLTSDRSRSVIEPAGDGGSPYAACFVDLPAGKTSRILGIYPSGADVEWKGGRICFSIPERQDGKPVALSAGLAEGTPGAYTPVPLEMAPLYNIVRVSPAHMPCTIKSLTLKAKDGSMLCGQCSMNPAGGERSASQPSVRVLLPEPLDCRGAVAAVPVMVLPDPAGMSFSAELEDIDGRIIAIDDVDDFTKEMNRPYTIGTSLAINPKQDLPNIRRIKDAGIEWIEVTCNSFQRNKPENEWEQRAEDIRIIVENLGLNVWSCHLPFSKTLDISLTDPEARKQSVEIQKRMIRLCGEKFHPKRLVLHPSSEPIADSERKARLDCARESIAELLPLAKEIGAGLCIENLPRTCLGRITQDMKYIIEPFPELMVCFDTNHLLVESHEKFFRELGDRIGTVHVSDYDRIDERHDLPGKGVIDWPAFHYMLRQCGYDGIFMYEVKSANGTPADLVQSYKNTIFIEQ